MHTASQTQTAVFSHLIYGEFGTPEPEVSEKFIDLNSTFDNLQLFFINSST